MTETHGGTAGSSNRMRPAVLAYSLVPETTWCVSCEKKRGSGAEAITASCTWSYDGAGDTPRWKSTAVPPSRTTWRMGRVEGVAPCAPSKSSPSPLP